MPALSIKDLDPRHERRLALAAILIVVAGIGWTLWRQAPRLLESQAVSAGDADGASTVSRAGGTTPPLSEFRLFGDAPDGAGTPMGEVAVNAPVTRLDLSLRGTLATRRSDQALAIVSDGEGRERTYRVGDELPGGATLHRVYRDRAILRRDGGLEALKLREPGHDSGAGSAPVERRTASGSTARAARQASEGDLSGAARTLRRDPAQLARDFTAVPVQEGGRMIGVRLRSTGDAALLDRVGLRGSDVVTSVNGIPLNDLSRTGEVITQLQSASEFRVTVLRNGREQQINVSLDQ